MIISSWLQTLPQPLLWVFLSLFALSIGSFLNVAIIRLPQWLKQRWRHECEEFLATEQTSSMPLSLTKPRSFCTHCKIPLRLHHNIPLISFFMLKGRCAHCQQKISWQYPLVEVFTFLVTIFIFLIYGFNLQAIAAVIFIIGLITLAIIDLKTKLLPDVITLPLLWLGLLFNSFFFFAAPIDAIWGAAGGYLLLFIFAKTFKFFSKQDGMGQGDFKLLAALGAWLGWQQLPFILLSSALLGSLVGLYSLFIRKNITRRTTIPFGPFLAFSGFCTLFIGEPVLSWYLGLVY